MAGENADNPTRGEYGRFVAAQPPTADAGGGAAVSASSDAPGTGETRHPPDANPYVSAAIALTGKPPVGYPDPAVSGSERTEPTTPAQPPGPRDAQAAAPSPSSAAAATPATAATASTPAQDAASVEAARQTADLKVYGDSLGAKEYQLLKSIPGMLPDPDAWKGMGQLERIEHLQEVRDLRNARMRDFNSKNNGAGSANPNDSTSASPEILPQPRIPRPAVSGVRDDRRPAPAGDAAPTFDQLPEDVRGHLQTLADEWGADNPLVKAQVGLALRNEQVVRQLESQQRQQQALAQSSANEQAARQFEDQVFSELSAKYPQLNDPSKRDGLRQPARELWEIRNRRGNAADPKEVIAFIAHNTFYPEIQQRQTEQAKADKARSLAGTFDRGAPGPSASTSPRSGVAVNGGSREAQMTELASRLNAAHAAGLSGEAARKAALVGAY